jgi:hypothetical protein
MRPLAVKGPGTSIATSKSLWYGRMPRVGQDGYRGSATTVWPCSATSMPTADSPGADSAALAELRCEPTCQLLNVSTLRRKRG